MVAEGRFRVMERFARPGQMEPSLRDVICHDFSPVPPPVRKEGSPFPTLEEFEEEEEHAATIPSVDGLYWSCVSELVALIEDFLLERPDESWAFAAGPRLHNPVLDRVRPSVRGGLVESVQANLAFNSSTEVLEHFKVTA
jgi:hypothetical protein